MDMIRNKKGVCVNKQECKKFVFAGVFGEQRLCKNILFAFLSLFPIMSNIDYANHTITNERYAVHLGMNTNQRFQKSGTRQMSTANSSRRPATMYIDRKTFGKGAIKA